MKRLVCFTFNLLFVLIAFTSIAFSKDYADYATDCEPLKGVIIPILRENGIPDEYFYLMVAESHCKDKRGKAGERGQWQMMPATARKYGCNDFSDIDCMTRSAAGYIKSIISVVGYDSESVVCAWNMGRHNYQKKGATYICKGLHWMMMHFKKTDETGV